jgi:cytochrome c oxidase cbb3-type subunit 3
LTRKSRTIRWRAAVLALSLLAFAGVHLWKRHSVAERMVRTDPAQILLDPALLQRAVDRGRPLYQKHCATCHGAALQGSPARGVPNLAKNTWLYGSDPVVVEHTILYGIRSGHPKAHNVTDMPALVRSGQISPDDARDVVELLQSLAGAPHDSQMAKRGRAIYDGKGNCFDCHAADAQGITDYGAPALTGPIWLYGGDRPTLYQSILNGRHGVCPAWIDLLSPAEIRALTIYLVFL